MENSRIILKLDRTLEVHLAHSVELVYVAHLGHMVHVIRQVNVDSHDSLGG